jgi:hypothetical protein
MKKDKPGEDYIDFLGREEREWFYGELLSYVDATFGEDEKDAQTYGDLRATLERFKKNKASIKDYETVLYQLHNKIKENCCAECNAPWFDEVVK